MTAERSRQTAAWFAAHPRLKAGVVAANRWLPLIPFACYPALLIWLGLKLGRRPDPASARSGPGGAGAGSGVSGRHSPAPGTQLPPPLPAARFRAAGAETAAGLLLSFPPCTERRCHCSGVAVFQPRRRGCADGRSPGHLRASGADRRTFCPGCSCRFYPWFCIGSGRYVAAVRPFAKKIKEFCILSLTEPVGYGIILLAACASHRSRHKGTQWDNNVRP